MADAALGLRAVAAALRREIDTLPGCDGSVTGRVIAEHIPDPGLEHP